METHQQRARAAHVSTGGMGIQTGYEDLAAEAEAAVEFQFVGYRALQQDSVVVALLRGGEPVDGLPRGRMWE